MRQITFKVIDGTGIQIGKSFAKTKEKEERAFLMDLLDQITNQWNEKYIEYICFDSKKIQLVTIYDSGKRPYVISGFQNFFIKNPN